MAHTPASAFSRRQEPPEVQQEGFRKGLWYLLLAQLLIWGLLPGLLVDSLPLDVVEGAYWVRA